MKSDEKDRWDKVQILGSLVGAVAVPVVLLLLGHSLTRSMKEGETRTQYVELAIEILQQEPAATEELPELRQWALTTLTTNLSLPLPSEASSKLLATPLPGRSISGGGCILCDGVLVCGTYVSCGP